MFPLLKKFLVFGGAYMTSCVSIELHFTPRPAADLNVDYHTTNAISTQREQKLICPLVCNHVFGICIRSLVFHEECTWGLVWQWFPSFKIPLKGKEKSIYQTIKHVLYVLWQFVFKGLAHLWLLKYVKTTNEFLEERSKGILLHN